MKRKRYFIIYGNELHTISYLQIEFHSFIVQLRNIFCNMHVYIHTFTTYRNKIFSELNRKRDIWKSYATPIACYCYMKPYKCTSQIKPLGQVT